MKASLLTIILVTFSLLTINAYAAAVHKWTDAQGNVHYGDKPPEKTSTKKVKIRRPGNDAQTSPDKGKTEPQKVYQYEDADLMLPAVKNNDIQTVVTLLKKKTYYNDEPLYEAIRLGHLSIFEALLDGNGDYKYDYLNNLQTTAIRNHRPDMLRSIIEKGANPNIQGRTNSPLMYAIQVDAYECLEVLVEYGADVKQNYSEAVRNAVKKNNITLLTMLLDNGGEVNPGPISMSNPRHTPLMLAAYNGYVDIMKILLERGADVNVRHYNNSTALGFARAYKHTEAEKILLEAGAKW